MLAPVVKATYGATELSQLVTIFRDATRLATTAPYGPVAVELPSDLMGTAAGNTPLSLGAPRPPTTLSARPKAASAQRIDAAWASACQAAGATLCAGLAASLAAQRPIVCDAGACSLMLSDLTKSDTSFQVHTPVNKQACLGFAVPAAIGVALVEARAAAKAAHDGAAATLPRSVVVLADAQALLMTGCELTTAATEGLPLVIIVPTYPTAHAEDDAAPPFLFGQAVELEPFAKAFGFPFLRHAATAGTDAAAAAADAIRIAICLQEATASCVVLEWQLTQPIAYPSPAKPISTALASNAHTDALAPLARRLYTQLCTARVGLLVGAPASVELASLMRLASSPRRTPHRRPRRASPFSRPPTSSRLASSPTALVGATARAA
jgi:thiamine pyrophosphate-dependent acetolactate synthase large subunit-like protein